MFKNPIVRSLLQIAGLSVIALFLTTASPKAASAVGPAAVSLNAASAFDECDDEYEACVERCGTWEYFWDGITYDTVVDQCWNPATGQWDLPCNPHPEPRYDWGWHADIYYFECIPNQRAGDCECAI
jgi:hypothetical protein